MFKKTLMEILTISKASIFIIDKAFIYRKLLTGDTEDSQGQKEIWLNSDRNIPQSPCNKNNN